MASDLPSEFDVIVLGSGMPESIVAAACARIGQSVLHIDRNEYYSGDWASFTLQGIEKWAKQHQEPPEELETSAADQSSLLEENETLIQLPLECANFSQIDLKFHVEEGEEIENTSISKHKLGTQIKSSIESIPIKDSSKPDENTEDGADPKDLIVPESMQSTATNELSESVQNMSINEKQGGAKGSSSETDEAVLGKVDVKGDNNEDTAKGDDEESTITGDEKEDTTKEDNQDSNTSCDKDTTDSSCDNDMDTKTEETRTKQWTINKLKAEWRKFNLDLSPKVIYSGGDMVELLISSDIAKYCEFKTITQMLTLLNGEIEKVPCSRADVFSSKKVTMIEKRMLMKFLQFCMEFENKREEITDFLQKPFTEFLTHKKLTANVRHYIQHSIAMATDSTTTEEGLKQMTKFFKSVGRYGNTAFLWSLYGSGELPQSFCRMCAVFGGLYCLRMPASAIIVDKENRCTGIITGEGQKIKCKWLIMQNSYAPPYYIPADSTRRLSRAIIMTDKPLLPTDQQELSLMCLPCPDDGDRPIIVLELPPTSQACPKDTYIFHLTRKESTDVSPEQNLQYAVDKLFKRISDQCDDTDQPGDRPTILWSLYFSQRDMSSICPTDQVPSNVILMSGPGAEIDIDKPVKEARDVFKRILPEEEFLPKAPNPEDIIYVDDTEAQVAEDSSQMEFKDTDSQSDESITGHTSNAIAGDENQSDSVSTDNSTNAANEMKTCENQSDDGPMNSSTNDMKEVKEKDILSDASSIDK